MQLRTAALIILSLALSLAVFGLLDPIAQDPTYHQFSDQRLVAGIPNFHDTLSNLAFLATGFFGLLALACLPAGIARGRAPWWPAAVWFFFSVMLIGLGSAYYHLAPDNDRLLWDRIPITLGAMSLLSTFIADRVDSGRGIQLYLPALLLAGAGSAVYWWLTQAAGQGDLRPYVVAQFLPLLAIACVCIAYPTGTWLSGQKFATMLLLYGLAKMSESNDLLIYLASGGIISGHSLKHYLAALATGIPVVHLLQLRHSPSRYLVHT